MNLVRQTILDKQGSSCLLRKTKRRKRFKEKKHIKGNRGEGVKGEQALGIEGGRSHMSSL